MVRSPASMLVAQIARVPPAVDLPRPLVPHWPRDLLELVARRAAESPARGLRFRASPGCSGPNPRQWISGWPWSTPEYARCAESSRSILRLPDDRSDYQQKDNVKAAFLPGPASHSAISYLSVG